MTSRFRRTFRIAALLTTIALTAGACGGDDSSTDDGDSSSGASGEVFISGSSTVAPISTRVAELFEDVNSDVFVTVEGPGTGDGFKKFCNGETDISDASRAIKAAEAETCADNGINYTEILVGIDGIGVLTNENNDAVACVTFDDLYGLIGPEAEGSTSWADANAISGGDLPDAPLDIFGPGEESGTFDSFIEIVIEDLAEEAGQPATTRPDYNPSADDNTILTGIASSDTTLGWVGFAFAENAAGVKLLDVDGGDGCTPANAETIASGEYPISRPLYIYVNSDKAAENAGLAEFVDFFVTTGLEEAVAEVGYVALSAEAQAESQATWNG